MKTLTHMIRYVIASENEVKWKTVHLGARLCQFS